MNKNSYKWFVIIGIVLIIICSLIDLNYRGILNISSLFEKRHEKIYIIYYYEKESEFNPDNLLIDKDNENTLLFRGRFKYIVKNPKNVDKYKESNFLIIDNNYYDPYRLDYIDYESCIIYNIYCNEKLIETNYSNDNVTWENYSDKWEKDDDELFISIYSPQFYLNLEEEGTYKIEMIVKCYIKGKYKEIKSEKEFNVNFK